MSNTNAGTKNIVVNPEVLAAALTEWHRRWVEDPDQFMSAQESMGLSAQTYGEESGPYLFSILEEQVKE
jgi:hypothetical protein